MNRFGLHRNHECRLQEGSRFRDSPRHSGQGVFGIFQSLSPAGYPVRGGDNHRKYRYWCNNPASCMNNMIFTGFIKKNLCAPRRFTPRPFVFPSMPPSKRFCTIIAITVGYTVTELCVVSYFISSVRNSTKHFLNCYRYR
jgi:hypothetical protein